MSSRISASMLSRRRYIIKEHEFGIGTIASVAAKFGVHQRLVRQAIGKLRAPADAPPPARPAEAEIRNSSTIWKLTATPTTIPR